MVEEIVTFVDFEALLFRSNEKYVQTLAQAQHMLHENTLREKELSLSYNEIIAFMYEAAKTHKRQQNTIKQLQMELY